MLDDIAMIRAGAQEHPLIASRRSVRAFEGQTVAQIVQAADLEASRGLPQVTLWRDGRAWTVPLDQWGRVRPKRGTTVDIHYDTQGPAAIAAVASTALSAAAPGIVSTYLGLTGLAATLATTAITVVGGLLINSLIAPPEQGGGNSDPNFAITGTGNVDAPYRPVPIVCGRHRMFPPKSASGYSETVDGDIYWRGRYCLGWGRVGLEDLRIGNTPITEFDDVEIEFLNVDKDYTLANVPGLDGLTQVKTAEEQSPGAVLREITETYEFEPQSVAGAVTLRIVPNDKLPGYGYNFRVDTREAGGAWVAGTPYTGQTAPVTWSSPVYADGIARTFRVILTAIQEPPEGQEVAPILALVHQPSISVTRATAEYQAGYAIKSWRFGAERMSLYPGDVAEEQMNVLLEEDTPVVRLTAKDAASAAIDISYPQGLYDSDDGETQRHEANFAFRYQRVGAATWTDAGTERHEADAQTLIRFTKSINFPAPGEYRVEVTRTDPIDTDSGDQNRGYLTAIRSFANTRIPSHKRVAEIAVRIKATDQLNGQIDSLNAIVQQFAPKWTGTGWGPQEPVRHPAWVFAELLRGPHLDRPVADTKIDRNALKAWADEEPHWTFDHVFDAETRVADAIRLVAAAGRAKPHLADLRYSVIRDGANGPIRQVFTPRNSWGFKGTLAFSREIHGFRVRFRSERLSWEQDEFTVYLDGYDETNATEFETLELPGVVVTADDADRGNPYRLARYHLATAILRPETYEWRADFEHLAVTRGDKVQLVHDVPQIGVGQGRIVDLEVDAGNLVALTLDDVQPGAGGIDFRMTIRRADGALVSFAADNGATLDGRWTVSETVAAAGIGLGDLVAIEKTTQETMEVLITGIYQDDDLAARLVGVPAAPAVLTADSEAIPDYDPIITRLPTRYGPPQPVPTRVFSDAATATKARDGVLRVRIAVELEKYEGPPGVWLRLRWSDPLRGGWIEGERLRPTATMFTGELPEGLPVAVEVRAEDRDGNHRGWVRAGEVNGSPGAVPPAPTGWSGTPGVRDVTLQGPSIAPADIAGWNVYEAQAEGGPYRFLTFVNSRHATIAPTPTYIWLRMAAVDYSGREGALGLPFQLAPQPISITEFADGIQPVEVVDSLPASGNYEGRTAVLTTDGKLYRYHDGSWTAAVPAVDVTGQLSDAQVSAVSAAKIQGQLTSAQIADLAAAKISGQLTNAQIAAIAAAKVTGQLTDGQIASIGAAKLTGQITSTQITDNAVSTPKLAAGAVSTAKLAAGAVVADKLAANSVTAAKILAGSVSTAALAAGAVVADKIAANAVTAVKLDAASVTAQKIAAGAVTTEKLAVGSANNILHNTEFWAGTFGWRIAPGGSPNNSTAESALALRQPGQSFAGPTYPTLEFGQSGTGADGHTDLRNLTVYDDAQTTAYGAAANAGKVYEASVQVSRHRCESELRIEFRDGNGDVIGYSPPTALDQGTGSTTNPDSWPRYVSRGTAPSGTASANIHLRKFGTTSGSNSYLFVHKPQVGETVANASEPLPYAPGGVTKIDGGQILADTVTARLLAAGSVVADKIAANAVTAAKIEAGAVEASKIAAGAITADKLDANAVTAGKIAAGAVSATELAANAVTAGKIAAGAISAGKLAAGAVTSEKVQAGSISADRLTIGSASNTIPNSDFMRGTEDWTKGGPGSGNSQSVLRLRGPGGDFTGADFPVLEVFQSTSAQDGYADVIPLRQGVDGQNSSRIKAVKPGEWYGVAAKLSIHRCTAAIYIYWYDDAGGVIATPGISNLTGAGSSTNPNEWTQHWVHAQAPANAAAMRVQFRKFATAAGEADSYLMIHQPQTFDSHAAASAPPPYVPGAATTIGPNGIRTSSIKTEKINGRAITQPFTDSTGSIITSYTDMSKWGTFFSSDFEVVNDDSEIHYGVTVTQVSSDNPKPSWGLRARILDLDNGQAQVSVRSVGDGVWQPVVFMDKFDPLPAGNYRIEVAGQTGGSAYAQNVHLWVMEYKR